MLVQPPANRKDLAPLNQIQILSCADRSIGGVARCCQLVEGYVVHTMMQQCRGSAVSYFLKYVSLIFLFQVFFSVGRRSRTYLLRSIC